MGKCNGYGDYCSTADHCVCDSCLQPEIDRLRSRVAEVERERDAYKRAKAENDERFQIERDAARAEVARLTAENERLRDPLCLSCSSEKAAQVAQNDRLTAERDAAQVACESMGRDLDAERAELAALRERVERVALHYAGLTAADPLGCGFVGGAHAAAEAILAALNPPPPTEPKRETVKCARTVCQNAATSGPHSDGSGRRYCETCRKAICDANGEIIPQAPEPKRETCGECGGRGVSYDDGPNRPEFCPACGGKGVRT